MRRTSLVFATVTALLSPVAAHAQEHMNHLKHMAASGGDSRRLVDFPPEMREHTLASMRDHLQALSEILAALSGGQYAKAAGIANARLGMDSPSAEGCRQGDAAQAPAMSAPASMDHRMAQFMPEGMRLLGLEMHKSASAFAAAAARSGKGGNAKPALAALARVTEQCAGCHAAYRLQ